LASPCAWPTNDKAKQSAKHLIEALTSLAASTVWFTSFAQTSPLPDTVNAPTRLKPIG